MCVVAVIAFWARRGSWLQRPPRRAATMSVATEAMVVYASMRWSNCTVAVFSKKLRTPSCMVAERKAAATRW